MVRRKSTTATKHFKINLKITKQDSLPPGINSARFNTPKAISVKITVFWGVTPCSLSYRCQCFGVTCRLYLESTKLRQEVFSFETSVYIYKTTRLHVPEDSIMQAESEAPRLWKQLTSLERINNSHLLTVLTG